MSLRQVEHERSDDVLPREDGNTVMAVRSYPLVKDLVAFVHTIGELDLSAGCGPAAEAVAKVDLGAGRLKGWAEPAMDLQLQGARIAAVYVSHQKDGPLAQHW